MRISKQLDNAHVERAAALHFALDWPKTSINTEHRPQTKWSWRLVTVRAA